jgi:arylsulfatase A-like enzyme
VGKGNYLVFLSADHGAAHVPSFMRSHKIPAGNFDTEIARGELDALLKEKFKVKGLLIDISNYQVFLNRSGMEENKIDRAAVNKTVIGYLLKNKAVQRAFVMDDLSSTILPSKIKEMVANGYYPGRSGDIQIILNPQWIDGFINGGTTHGVWNAYDSHIPFVLYGWNIPQGKTTRETYMTDIAPTIAALLKIQMPSGCVGHAIEEVTKTLSP